MFGARGIHADEGEVDLGLSGGRKLDPDLLGGFTNTLDSHRVTRKINISVLLELCEDMLDESDVEVLATKVSVSVGRFDLEDAALQFEDGNIEGSATQVVNGHDVFTRLVRVVSESSGSGLVNDRGHVETSDLSGENEYVSMVEGS